MSFDMQPVKIDQPPIKYDYASLARSTEGPPNSPPGVGHFAFVDADGQGALVVVTPSMLTGIIGALVELRDRLADLESGVTRQDA